MRGGRGGAGWAGCEGAGVMVGGRAGVLAGRGVQEEGCLQGGECKRRGVQEEGRGEVYGCIRATA